MPLFSTKNWRAQLRQFLKREPWNLIAWADKIGQVELRQGRFLILDHIALSRWQTNEEGKGQYKGPRNRDDYVDIADALKRLAVITQQEARNWIYNQGLLPLDDEVDIFGEQEDAVRSVEQLISSAILETPEVIPPEFDLVGRDKEWDILNRVWESARASRPQLVLIHGEPGFGKTHLAKEFYFAVKDPGYTSGYTVVWANCDESVQKPAYEPIRTWLSQIEAFRAASYLHSDKKVVLDVLWGSARGVPNLGSELQRSRFFEALREIILTIQQPILLIVDNLHRCDLDTLEWVTYLMQSADSATLMILGTIRSRHYEDFVKRWQWRSLESSVELTSMQLGSLSANESANLVKTITGRDISDKQIGKLNHFAEGHPFIVVETARSPNFDDLIENLATNESPMSGPQPTGLVEEYVAGLVDEMNPTLREVADQAATIGRTFQLARLARISRQTTENLSESLDLLCHRGFIQQLSRSTFRFRHELYRTATYNYVLNTRPRWKQQMHLRVAEAIIAEGGNYARGAYAEVAFHYEKARTFREAIKYYRLACEQELQRQGIKQVIEHLETCIRLSTSLQTEGWSPDDIQTHVELLLELASMRSHVYGQASPYAEEAYRLALKTNESIGIPNPLVLWGLAMTLAYQARYAEALPFVTECFKIAKQIDNTSLLSATHALYGFILFFTGEFEQAYSHFEEGNRFYRQDDMPLRPEVFRFVQDPKAVCECFLGMCDWIRGRPDIAMEHLLCADSHATRLKHNLTQVMVKIVKAMIHHLRGEWSDAQTESIMLTLKAEAYDFPVWIIVGKGWQDLAYTKLNSNLDKLPTMHQLHDNYRGTGSGVNYSYWPALVGQACAELGAYEDGQQILDTALQFVGTHGEHYFEGELWRVQGELLALSGQLDESSACFEKACGIAKKQKALSLELRAVMSLYRHAPTVTKKIQAQNTVREIYQQFQEGHDTADLRQAAEIISESLN